MIRGARRAPTGAIPVANPTDHPPVARPAYALTTGRASLRDGDAEPDAVLGAVTGSFAEAEEFVSIRHMNGFCQIDNCRIK